MRLIDGNSRHLVVVKQSNRQELVDYTWELMSDVVATLTAWMRLYDYRALDYDVFDGDVRVWVGSTITYSRPFWYFNKGFPCWILPP